MTAVCWSAGVMNTGCTSRTEVSVVSSCSAQARIGCGWGISCATTIFTSRVLQSYTSSVPNGTA